MYGHYVEHTESKVYKCTGATVIPQINLNILKYSNGIEVYPWVRGSLMFDATKWNSGEIYINYNKYSFISNTDVTGTVSGSVYCEGAIIPYRAISVSQKMSIL